MTRPCTSLPLSRYGAAHRGRAQGNPPRSRLRHDDPPAWRAAPEADLGRSRSPDPHAMPVLQSPSSPSMRRTQRARAAQSGTRAKWLGHLHRPGLSVRGRFPAVDDGYESRTDPPTHGRPDLGVDGGRPWRPTVVTHPAPRRNAQADGSPVPFLRRPSYRRLSVDEPAANPGNHDAVRWWPRAALATKRPPPLPLPPRRRRTGGASQPETPQ